MGWYFDSFAPSLFCLSACLPVWFVPIFFSRILVNHNRLKVIKKEAKGFLPPVNTFLHNSILLPGLEFNYRMRDFICPWHWFLIDCNAIRNCTYKSLYCTASEKMMWSSRYGHSVEIGQQAYSFYSFVDIFSCRLSDQCHRSNDTNVVFVSLILLC